jgi:hypothetical protein
MYGARPCAACWQLTAGRARRAQTRKVPAFAYPPVLRWLPAYSWGKLRADLFAGASVGALLLPMSLAYSVRRRAVCAGRPRA